MKIEITMTELLLIVDMIKNGVERTEPSSPDEDLVINFVTEEETEEIVLKRKKKK